ncbi:MAG: MBL fold metallo-hydrolase [Betaproteobacteria bacterium AqS2]|uniref:MBL fold metallo-hydrolase n=1 Tax=Candidatus Amphirhobacter heronislandensis TaxID=1732024 RepID=A0A930XY34_9GAMM|nr:MBL fold metallo-hydrolase [Betaproteobacteria bacterium AqS2]
MTDSGNDWLRRDLGAGWSMLDSGYNRPGHTAIYICVDDGKALVYDAAHTASAERVVAALAERGVAPDAVELVVVSHAHLDHSGGCGALLKLLPHAKAMVHPDIIEHLAEPARLIEGARQIYGGDFDRLYGEIAPTPRDRIVAFEEAVKLGGRELALFNTPGHTFAHLCLHDPQAGVLLAGDVFGAHLPHWNGTMVVPAAPTQFAPREWKASVDAIMARAPERILLAHFGVLDSDLEGKAQQLRDEIDHFVAIAREAKEQGGDRDFIADRVMAWWEPKFKQAGAAVDRDEVGVELLLTVKGLALWLEKHLETYAP